MIINEKDNVEVNTENGHKYAVRDIEKGEKIIKYGYPIGVASENIKKGDHVHSHNLKTALSGTLDYKYEPNYKEITLRNDRFFYGYRRKNGDVGVRNEVWIIPTVGCVNGIAKRVAQLTGTVALTHPFGCSQLGDDLKITQTVLAGLAGNPNAAGVLILGLGCETNNLKVFSELLDMTDSRRLEFVNAQDEEDEISASVSAVNRLKAYADSFVREKIPLSELKIGIKCGGSDGLSGITANPMVGRFSDRFAAYGGKLVMTEVPEMFGAETILMNRAVDFAVFDKTVDLINRYKEYFISHGQVVYENPSPGNKEGGITTLEEKSLGCVTKAGAVPVVDVLDYGDRVAKSGLSLLNGPGNDIVACTNLAAAGCQLVLFTTGRGTPLGSPLPTVKISTNRRLSAKKADWIDFNAGELLDESKKDAVDAAFFEYVISVANGEQTKNEINAYKEISIFKDGVVL